MTSGRAAGFRNGIDVRVRLRGDGTTAETAFDGAWWPRSRDLAVELPELVAALELLGVRIERFTHPRQPWETLPPRKVTVNGRLVRTGAFGTMHPQLVSLTAEGGRRIDLLVVPPEADALTGVRALRMSGQRDERNTPQYVLAAAGSRPVPEVTHLTGRRRAV
jgi:hypothetical protein